VLAVTGVVKVIGMAPYALDGDPSNWGAAKESHADSLLSEYAKLAGHANATVTLGHYTQAVRGGEEAVTALEEAYS
jgi:hypothetical protein